VLRATSEAPKDAYQARLDAWGETIMARIDEAQNIAKDAHSRASRASLDNIEQDSLMGSMAADIAALREKHEAVNLVIETAVKKLSGLSSPQVATLIGTIATIAAGALAAFAKGKGWIP
jgi:hypothetical protein